MWLNVFFGLFAFRSAAQLFKIWVIKYFYNHVLMFDIAKLVIIDSCMIGWLVYGNIIYYSKQNDCERVQGTMFLAEFMSCILFIGYLMIGMYGLILLTLPCLYMMVRQAEREQMERHLIPRTQV